MSGSQVRDAGLVEFHGDEIVANILTIVRQFSPGINLDLTFRVGKGRTGTLDERTRMAVAALLVGDKAGGLSICHPVSGHVQGNYEAVGRSGYWSVVNRTVTVTLADHLDFMLFVEGIAPGLEHIKFTPA
ncbi:MAG: hypothetical protein ABSG74_13540 [Candidatus Bathyarchaeia archaeon]|jgi:hypothetical protein